MGLPRPAEPDSLRPTATQALDAWAARVRADREQVNRCREIEDPSDFYGPVAERFRYDPRRDGDQVLRCLRDLARPAETWLDIGAGGGRYALPIALLTREVICVDPSRGMLEVLRETMREHAIDNVRIVEGRWPIEGLERAADVSLVAHLGYDVEQIGPFLDAMETATRRTCVAVLSQGAMTTVGTHFWEPIHGEPRVPLPALPEFLSLLLARDRLAEVRLVDRQPPTFDSIDDLLWMARRQLWIRPGSDKDAKLEQLVRGVATERDGRWALDWSTPRIGVVTWEPRPVDAITPQG
jgi:SAM-dependent methyltransferase